jgi:hypothetical protein
MILAALSMIVATPAWASSGKPQHPPVPLDPSAIKYLTTTGGGAAVLPTTRTIPHWWGSSPNPDNGVTYGYNIVGANPYTCSGTNCSVTIEVDVTPLIVRVDGVTFSGADHVPALLASPIFALNDYGSTPFVTTGPFDTPYRGPGGVLSQGDAGAPLQMEDAIMRSGFNQTGASGYHLILHANVKAPVTVDVPANQGVVFQYAGNIFPGADYSWWSSQIKNLTTKSDPTHFSIFLSDNLFLYYGSLTAPKGFGCCVLGYHNAATSGPESNGNAPVVTFAYATWFSPFEAEGDPLLWFRQDMVVLTHEISEWAHDPFATNYVEPWTSPETLFCSPLLETGDAVDFIGFAIGTNNFDQGPNADGTQTADGYWHAQDELHVPWFMRLAPNLMSEPTQSPSPNVGRYSFLGDLDAFGYNSQPAPGC